MSADPALAAFLRVTDELTATGGLFEMAEENVLGQPMSVFRKRSRSLREILVRAHTHGDRDCFVFSDGRRITFAPNWMLAAAPDCVGPPLPTVDVRITGVDGTVLPDGREGHICVRSPLVMPGYWRHDGANAEVFDTDRWYRTGDFGRMEGGLLFIASRLRDLIIRGGENIYPFEIENRLEEHADVVEVAVFGVDHHELGQEVKAVVVVRPGATLTVADVREHCAATLSSYKIPAHVELRTDPLPRNATGKVMKQVLSGEGENTFIEE